ncbi:MAG: hypothetical protein E7173_00570 [Firmicutes bacterium]|nr:hypothetical protein [Bacillota bacterium]
MKKVALLGDSITEYMPYVIDKEMRRGFNVPMVSDKLPDNDIIFNICGVSNIGVGSYHNYCWKDVEKDEIDCFVLLIGINNLLRPDCDYDGKESLDDTFEKIKLFIQDIISSGKDILVQLLYPTKYINTNAKVVILNEKLRKYCEENEIDYLDLYNELLGDDGIINHIYTEDGLHPNESCYMFIIDHISKKIKLKNGKVKKL